MPGKDIAVLDRLITHLEKVAIHISNSMLEASEKHTGTPESVANAREMVVRKTLERFFPFPFKITKGSIYDSFGARSQSIDCVICAPNHPFLIDESGNIEIILVDGTFCAIEIKPDLTDLPSNFGVTRKQDPEIIRALKQIQSVKRLKRTESMFACIGGNKSHERIDYSSRCPAYIFSNDSSEITELANYTYQYYQAEQVPREEQFDVLMVLKKGLIFNNKAEDYSITKMFVDDHWVPHMAAYGVDKAFSLFIYRLVSEIGPEMQMSTPVLQRYLNKFDRPKPIWGQKT